MLSNWTSPLDAAKLLDLFVSRPLFTEPHQTFIKQTMIECETGKDRLAQPLEATDAIIGHKTGTGDLNARWQLIGTNDIGFVFLPDEERYTIAVFAKDSEESRKQLRQSLRIYPGSYISISKETSVQGIAISYTCRSAVTTPSRHSASRTTHAG